MLNHHHNVLSSQGSYTFKGNNPFSGMVVTIVYHVISVR